MRLCIVTHKVSKGDGQGRVNYEVAWEAIRRGHELILLASDISPDLMQNNKVRWIHIPVKDSPTMLLKNIVFSQRASAWLDQHRSEYDLVKVNGAITSFKSDVNAVHFLHSSWLQSPAHTSRQYRNHYGAYQWLYTRLNAYWEKKSFERTNVIIAVSERVRQDLLKLGIASDKVKVILNGVDLQEFRPGESDRTQLNLPEGVPLALFAGDIRSNRKNLDTVIRALVQIPALHLAVVGAIERSPYPALSKHLHLADRIHFLGYRSDISSIMKAVDFFVLPSRYEPFGMVISEALATGLPVITSEATGASVLVSSDCGIVLSKTDDVNALAQAMQTLVNDQSLRQQMGQAARQIAEQHGWNYTSAAYVDLFEALKQI